MTAPALDTPQPIPADVSHDPMAAMEAVIGATKQQTPGALPDEADGDGLAPVIDSQGRAHDPVTGAFLSKDAVENQVIAQPKPEGEAAAVAAADAETADEGEPSAPEIPEGFVAAAVLPEERTRGFKVLDPEGNEIQAPDLTFTLTANGKPLKLSTDKLVSYAQMGVYNHDREVQAEQARQTAQQAEARAKTIEQSLAERDAQIERLLSDDDYLTRALELYAAQNTPEAVAQRAQQQLESERKDRQTAEIARQSEHFVNTDLAPALETIANALPTVSREELAYRLFVAAEQYKVDGVLHPSGYDPLRQYVVTDLVQWAQQVHAHRESERTNSHNEPPSMVPVAVPKAPAQDAKVQAAEAARLKAEQDARDARARAQKAKRNATGTLRPAGRIAPEVPAPTAIRNQRDAESAVVGNTLAALRSG